MTGQQLKEIITKRGVSTSAVAFAIGVTHPAMQSTYKSPDVKSSIIEDVAHALGLTLAQMYEMAEGITPQTNRPAVIGEPSPSLPYPQTTTPPPPASDPTDLTRVLLHLVAVIDDQSRKIDLLSQHIATIEAKFLRKPLPRHPSPVPSFAYDLDTEPTTPTQVADPTATDQSFDPESPQSRVDDPDTHRDVTPEDWDDIDLDKYE